MLDVVLVVAYSPPVWPSRHQLEVYSTRALQEFHSVYGIVSPRGGASGDISLLKNGVAAFLALLQVRRDRRAHSWAITVA